MQAPASGSALVELEEIISDLARQTGPEADPSGGAIHLHRVLAGLGRSNRDSPPRNKIDVLDHLCRKLAVAKRVWALYTEDWQKMEDATPLAPEDWTLLVAVLARYGAPDRQQSDAWRPVRLKWLNGALLARDLAPTDARDGRFQRVAAILDAFVETVREQCVPSP